MCYAGADGESDSVRTYVHAGFRVPLLAAWIIGDKAIENDQNYVHCQSTVLFTAAHLSYKQSLKHMYRIIETY